MTDGETSVVAPMVVNGWSIYAHPIFLDQLEGLIAEVEERKRRDPKAWQKKNCTKRLAAIFKLVGQDIPADPGAPQFRQGGTLGDERKHWFRAKFFQRYRLFYRFKSDAKVIVLAWVNDDETLRGSPQGLFARPRFSGQTMNILHCRFDQRATSRSGDRFMILREAFQPQSTGGSHGAPGIAERWRAA